MAEYENTFVREVKEKNIIEPADILNWYRNLYHTEDNHTEHGIMAYAINDYFNDVVPKSEVEELNRECESLGKTVNEASELIRKLKGKVEEAKTEVAREIFEEIENNLVSIDDVDFNRFRCIGARTFTELKKKYIGEKE